VAADGQNPAPLPRPRQGAIGMATTRGSAVAPQHYTLRFAADGSNNAGEAFAAPRAYLHHRACEVHQGRVGVMVKKPPQSEPVAPGASLAGSPKVSEPVFVTVGPSLMEYFIIQFVNLSPDEYLWTLTR
jgi:hypothetical protein